MIHIYYGDGKGKTTAAIGLTVRAAGEGFHVWFCQFMKGNDTGELMILREIRDLVILRPQKKYPFYKNMSEAEKAELREEHNKIIEKVIEIPNEESTLIVLDELTYAISYGLIDIDKVNMVLNEKKKTEIVITGRNPQEFLLEQADYITNMKKEKHPYNAHIPARKGIEY